MEGRLNVAETGLKEAGDRTQAAAMFLSAVTALRSLRETPAQLRKDLARTRDATLAQLEGKWSLGACNEASTWMVRGNALRVAWPGSDLYEARVAQVLGTQITAIVLSPENQKGRLYRYTRDGNRLEVEDASAGRRALLSHCP